ncbi:MAG: thiol:disulfide interchange protein DsbA/DsbL [Pseudomonadota bacterium]
MRTLLLSLSLFVLASLAPAAAQQAPLRGLSEGVEYRLIEGGTPYRAQPGKIEVAEIFAYWCHHCANFDPMLDAWKRTLPASASFVAVPLVSSPDDAYGRVYFAAEASKSLPVLHPRLFKAIHQTNELPKAPRLEQVVAFSSKVPGINATAFKAALADDATLRAKLARAGQFAQRSDIPGTPSLVIDGRYLVLGNSYESLLGNARKIVAALAPAAAPAGKRPASKPSAPKPRS